MCGNAQEQQGVETRLQRSKVAKAEVGIATKGFCSLI